MIESDFVHQFTKGVNFKLIQTLEKLVNFTLSDWKKITYCSIKFGDIILFHHCLQIIPNSTNFEKKTRIFAKELMPLDDILWNEQLNDEINKPYLKRDDSWISICIITNRFDFIESLPNHEFIYSKLNQKFWTISLFSLFDHKRNESFQVLESILTKFRQLYNKDLVLTIKSEWEILSVLQSNDPRIFEWAKDQILKIDPSFEKVKNFVIEYRFHNLYHLVLDEKSFISKEFLIRSSFVSLDVEIFEYVLKHRHLCDITDAELWTAIIKRGEVSLMKSAKEMISSKLNYYASEIKSLEVAQLLVEFRIPVDWIKIKTPETLVWLIKNDLVRYEHIKKDGLYFLAMIEQGNDLLKIIQQKGDLEEAMWYYIDFNSVSEIYSFVHKNYLRFLKKCYQLISSLPDLSAHIQDIVFFAYDSNDILIFDFLVKCGYDLFQIPNFKKSISFYQDDFVGFEIWQKYKEHKKTDSSFSPIESTDKS